MKGTATLNKGEIGARRAPADLVRDNIETDHSLKSHIGTPGRHLINGTVPDRMDTMTKDQNRRRNGGTTMPQWML